MSVRFSFVRASLLTVVSVLLSQPVLAAEAEVQTPISQVQSGAGTGGTVRMMNSTDQVEPSHYHDDDNNLSALNGVSLNDFGGTGPVSIAGLYDNEVGYYVDATGSMPFGDRAAGALELAGGEYIYRANGTLGFALNAKNRIKATVENLGEKLEYDFESGSIRHWESQMAYGGAYEYVFGGQYIDAFDLGGYYSHSSSDSLSPKTVDGSTTGRYITGADNYDANAFVKYHLWPKSQLKTGLSWDRASFDYRYDNEDESGFGAILGLKQLITEQIKVSVDSTIGAVEDTVTGQVGVLVPAPKGTRLELSYVTDYVHGHTTDRDFFTNGIKAAFSWGYPKTSRAPRYTDDFGPINQQTLQQWTSDPAVRMSEVIAFADQATAVGTEEPMVRAFMDVCPPPESFRRGDEIGPGDDTVDANGIPRPELPEIPDKVKDKLDGHLGNAKEKLLKFGKHFGDYWYAPASRTERQNGILHEWVGRPAGLRGISKGQRLDVFESVKIRQLGGTSDGFSSEDVPRAEVTCTYNNTEHEDDSFYDVEATNIMVAPTSVNLEPSTDVAVRKRGVHAKRHLKAASKVSMADLFSHKARARKQVVEAVGLRQSAADGSPYDGAQSRYYWGAGKYWNTYTDSPSNDIVAMCTGVEGGDDICRESDDASCRTRCQFNVQKANGDYDLHDSEDNYQKTSHQYTCAVTPEDPSCHPYSLTDSVRRIARNRAKLHQLAEKRKKMHLLENKLKN